MDIVSPPLYFELDQVCLPIKDDTIDIIYHQNKASWSRYVFYSSLLILISPLTTAATVYVFTVNYFKKNNKEYKTTYNQIRDYLKYKKNLQPLSEANAAIPKITKRILALTSDHLKPVLLDVLSLDKDLSHIKHILQGANVKIEGDKGLFFNKWKTIQGAYERKSSHSCDEDGAYSLHGNFFHEFLFWKDPITHCTRFQLEKSSFNPFRNPAAAILHTRDYLNYKRLNLQQGPFGSSAATDKNPICIHHYKTTFEKNKRKLQDLFSITE